MQHTSWAVAVWFIFASQPAFAADPKGLSAEAINAAKEKADDYLKSIKAMGGQVTVVEDDATSKLFPKHVFVTVLFRQFPVARPAPAPLKHSNVLVVPVGEGKVVPITDVKGLESIFQDTLPAITPKLAPAVVSSWLRLAQEFSQDGFYKFGPVAAPAESKGLDSVSGTVSVIEQGGNKGFIKVKLHFSAEGKLTKVENEPKLMPGPRPICQATKLLDPDPIVRRMAEDSIRVMGRACGYYLEEQRAKASPELQQAIDRIRQRIVDEDR